MLYDCDRCGRTCLSEDGYRKSLDRGKTPLCRDCQARQLFRVQYAEDYCVPHQGFFDTDDYPIDEWGQRLYLDESTCKHRDCVRVVHHTEPAAVAFVMPVYKTPKKRNATVSNFGLIMALAEAQEYNSRVKRV
jgi:hypothetical protein